ncbi:tetratricopeptide repeat protein [Pseudotenacibaculum haliotis]|uniref:Tetratricopeptide repeat protein n=1 Tax=Pseudotenacibaculum haliotis TaxID=1862138 RepID=A0ABW5LUI0_9FLAO
MRYLLSCILTLFFLTSISSQEVDTILVNLKEKVKESQSEIERAIALTKLGEHQIETDLPRAEQSFLEVKNFLESCKGHDHTRDTYLANAYNKLGVINRRKANYIQALNYYLDSKKMYEEMDDYDKVGDVIHNIGIIFRYQEDYKRSISNFKKAIRINEQTKDTFGVAAAYNMMGVSYRRLNKIDSAMICYQKAKDLFKKLKREEDIRGVDNNLATLYSSQGDHQKSLPIKLDNLNYYKSIGNKMSTCVGYFNISRDYSSLQDYDTSLKYADSSLTIALQEGFKERISKAFLRKSYVYRKKEDYKNAYDNYRSYKRYSDSIFNIESVKRIQELELMYEFEKERKELEVISDKQKSEVQLYVFLFVLTLIVGTTVGYLLYRNYTARARIVREKLEKEKLKKELLREKVKVSESELKSLVADNSMRLKFIIELSDKIKEDKKQADSKDIQQYTQSLILQLQQQIATESKLSSIQDRIEEVNRGFDSKIVKLYPSLTKTEREVCALLRLNLSIKEIASIRNATTDSVKASRYRIRKKLQVPSGEELEHFIQSL